MGGRCFLKVDFSSSSEGYSKKLLLLDGLASQAPRLRHLTLTANDIPSNEGLLARLGRVTQLEELGLTGWHYSTAEELHGIAHLSSLRSQGKPPDLSPQSLSTPFSLGPAQRVHITIFFIVDHVLDCQIPQEGHKLWHLPVRIHSLKCPEAFPAANSIS